MTGAATEELPRPLRLVFGVALAVYVGIAAWLVWRTAILEPFSDMYDWVARYYQYQADGRLAPYLWAPHNFHHLVWTFGVLALDIRLFGANSYLFVAVAVACLALITAMLSRVAEQAAGPGLRLAAAGGIVGICAMGCYVQVINVDINMVYVHALVFAVAAILLSETPRRGGWAIAVRAAALLCAVGAGLGSAAGLAVWPALAFGAWRRGDWRWLAAVLVVGGLFSAVYVLGQSAPLNPATGSVAASRWADGALLFVNYLGLPWVRGAPELWWLFGPIIIALAAAALTQGGGKAAAASERIAVELIVFSLTTAAMAVIARNGVADPRLVPMRYAIFMTPLHAGLWILALPLVRRRWLERRQAWQRLFLGAAVLMLLHQGLMAVYAVRTGDLNRTLIAEFHAGGSTPDMLITIYPDLAKARELTARMKHEGLYQRELTPDPRPVS